MSIKPRYSVIFIFFLVIAFSNPHQFTQSLDTQGQPHWDTSDALTSQLYIDWGIGANGTVNRTHTVTDVYTSNGDLLYDVSIVFDESDIPFYPVGTGVSETRYDLNSSYYNYFKATEYYIPPTTSVSGYESYIIELLYEETNASRFDLNNMEEGVYYVSSFQTFNKSYFWPEPNPYPEYPVYELTNVSIIERHTITRVPITVDGKNYWTYKHERLNYYSEVLLKRVFNLDYAYYELDKRYYNEDQTVLTAEYTRDYYYVYNMTYTLDLIFSYPFLYDKCTWYEEVIGYPMIESDPWYANYDPIEINETTKYGSAEVATLFSNSTVTSFDNQFLFYYTPTETVTEVSDHTVTETITDTNEITNTATVTDVVTMTDKDTSTVYTTSIVELTTVITNVKSELHFSAMFIVMSSLIIIGFVRRKR